ncbi:MAG: hypothetical protein CM15mP89_4600 [Gammaproteobacteria bacterium]|nr:MAG: hypothetical protein CM15mP89_4600 [Gammaproteobacteria bacterium]
MMPEYPAVYRQHTSNRLPGLIMVFSLLELGALLWVCDSADQGLPISQDDRPKAVLIHEPYR